MHLAFFSNIARRWSERYAWPFPWNGLGLWCFGAVAFGALAAWASFHTVFPGEIDLSVWLRRHSSMGILGYEEFADVVGARNTLYYLTGIGVLLFVVLRRWNLLLLVTSAPLLALAGLSFKPAIERPRPTAEQVGAITNPASGFSFPSGHSLQAAVVCSVAVIIAQELLTGRVRRVVQGLAIWFALTVGWERVFDGVHWPTDVAGGFLLGMLAVYGTWHLITLLRAQGTRARRASLAARFRRRSEPTVPV